MICNNEPRITVETGRDRNFVHIKESVLSAHARYSSNSKLSMRNDDTHSATFEKNDKICCLRLTAEKAGQIGFFYGREIVSGATLRWASFWV